MRICAELAVADLRVYRASEMACLQHNDACTHICRRVADFLDTVFGQALAARFPGRAYPVDSGDAVAEHGHGTAGGLSVVIDRCQY